MIPAGALDKLGVGKKATSLFLSAVGAFKGAAAAPRQNVVVCCRFRPRNQVQEMADNSDVLQFHDTTGVSLLRGFDGKGDARFNFDRVFTPEASQDLVYQFTAEPLVAEVFAGYNCTVFAYGQTGSGKTFTMMGADIESPNRGIIPRLCEQLFQGIENADDHLEFTLSVQYMEIYMEHIRDLLDPRKENLMIREDNAGVYVQDATEIYVNAFHQILDVMKRGDRNRSIARTKMNFESSRSHSVFLLTLGQRNKVTGSKKSAKLFLVDLAGSEKVQKTEAEGQTLEEAKYINKSLSSLGNVINHLTEGKQHIPYRDSKLTRLLSDSLGGNSKTCLIITASPAFYNIEETLSTLRFGARAKRIKNKPVINQEKSAAEMQLLLNAANKEIERLKQMVMGLENDVRTLKAIIKKLAPDFDLAASGVLSDASKAQMSPEQAAIAVALSKDTEQMVKQLQAKLDEMEKKSAAAEEKAQTLQEEMLEKDSELDIQTQMLEDNQEEIDNMKVELALAKDKIQELMEKVAEYSVFRKKVHLMEQEYIIQLDELEVENADLTEKLHALLLNEIEAKYAETKRAKRTQLNRSMLVTRADIEAEMKNAPAPVAAAKATPQKQQAGAEPQDDGVASKMRDMQEENKRLRQELSKRTEMQVAAQRALDELKANMPPAMVDTAQKLTSLTQQNTFLGMEVDKLRRQNETQERLLQNRQSHIEVLELALQEANAVHKRVDAERKQQMEDLQKKLKSAHDLLDELYGRGKDGVLSPRKLPAAGHMVIPLVGGKHRSDSMGEMKSDSGATSPRGQMSPRGQVSPRGGNQMSSPRGTLQKEAPKPAPAEEEEELQVLALDV